MSDTPNESPAPESETAAATAAATEGKKAHEMSLVECADQLKARFPALFGGAPKPLKLRIQVDIQERAPGVFPKSTLSAFFRRYTGGTGYLVAVTRAKTRFDLDGQPAGELTDEHREVAQQELNRRRAITEGRRAEEEKGRRERSALLRDFERTTLTPANFCALKGIPADQLEAVLAQARQEAAEQPAQPRHPHPRAGQPRGDRGERGERREGRPGQGRGGRREGGSGKRPPRA